MVLTKENMNEWLKLLDAEAEKRLGIKNYQSLNYPWDWFAFEGQTVDEVINDDIFYSGQC